MGGETEFLYEDLFTKEELLIQLLQDKEMQCKMFDWMDKGRRNPNDLQTSDPSDNAGQGRF